MLPGEHRWHVRLSVILSPKQRAETDASVSESLVWLILGAEGRFFASPLRSAQERHRKEHTRRPLLSP